MAADAGFCSLTHFDLNRRAGVEIILINPESSGSHLNDRVFAIAVEVFVQTSFTGIIQNAEFRCGACQRGVGVVADRSVTHGGEHDGHG